MGKKLTTKGIGIDDNLYVDLGGYPRATSVVKNNGLLLQKNFSQMSSLSKSHNAKKLTQITNSINNNLGSS
jgi:hypothetical protein